MVVHAPGFSNGVFCESFLWKTGIVDGWLFEKFQSGRVIDSKSSFPTLNICESEPGLPHWLISNISSYPTILKDPNKKPRFCIELFAKLLKSLKMISYFSPSGEIPPKDTRHQGLDQLIKYYRSLELEMFPEKKRRRALPVRENPRFFICEQLSTKEKKPADVSCLNHFFDQTFFVRHVYIYIWPSWGFFPLKNPGVSTKNPNGTIYNDHLCRFFFAKETTVWCIHFFQSISVKAS